MKTYPTIVKFAHDFMCVGRCITCRSERFEYTKKYIQKLDKLIDFQFIPILKDAKIVYLNNSGDLFMSPHCRKLIKEIAKTYPNIRFNLITNGLLCDEINLTELNILNKLNEIRISVHAATKETYNLITLRTESEYNRVFKNIEWLSSIKDRYNFDLILNYVVSSSNFHEIIAFAERCVQLDVKVDFWECKDWLKPNIDYNEFRTIFTVNYMQKRLESMLKHEIFDSPKCRLSGILMDVRNQSYNGKKD